MAVSIGPRIGIEGEKEFRKEMQNIIQSTKTLKAQMDACSSSFDKDSKSIKKAKEQHQILKQTQEKLRTECQKLGKAVEESAKKYGENDTKTLKWKESLAKAETELNKVNEQLKNTSAAKAWGDAISACGEKLKDMGEKITGLGKDLSAKVTAPILAVGTASVKLSADFDSSMSQVQATMGLTNDAMSSLNGSTVNSMDALRELAKELGSKTKFSAKEAAEGINYLALAGYDVQQAYDTLPTILNLAAAGSMDLARASDMVTDAMSALGDSAGDVEHFADVLAKTASSSNTSVEQLGNALLTVGGTAKVLKGGVDEASAVLGILANNGIKASEGGTALRNILLALNPTTKKAKDAWQELGVSAYDTDGNMRNLQDTIKDLVKATAGMSDQKKTDILSKMFNKNDLKAVQALMADCGDSWDDLVGKISGADGAASDMAATQLDNLNGRLTMLKSAIEGAAISIGERLSPYIEDLVGMVQSAADWFNNLSDAQMDMIVKVGALVAVIGPALVVVGSVVSAVGTLVTAFGAMVPAVSAVVGVIGGVVAGFGLVPIAIAAVGAACIALIANWDKVKAKAGEIKENVGQKWNEIKTNMGNVIDQAKARTSSQFSEMQNRISTAMGTIGSTIGNKFNDAKNKAAQALEGIKTKASSIINSIKSIFNVTIPHPKIQLPTISISGGFSLNPPSVPKFSIKWYRAAYDQVMEFDKPTVLGSRGFGDGAGREYVVGESHMSEVVYRAVVKAIGGSLAGVQNILETYLPGCANQQIYLDGNTLVGATSGRMNTELGRMAYRERR